MCRIAFKADNFALQLRKTRDELVVLLGKHYDFGRKTAEALSDLAKRSPVSEARATLLRQKERGKRVLKWNETLVLCWQSKLERFERRRKYLENAIHELSRLVMDGRLMRYHTGNSKIGFDREFRRDVPSFPT